AQGADHDRGHRLSHLRPAHLRHCLGHHPRRPRPRQRSPRRHALEASIRLLGLTAGRPRHSPRHHHVHCPHCWCLALPARPDPGTDMKRNRVSTWLLYGALTVFSLVWLVPVMTALMTSIRPLDEIRGGWWDFEGATFTLDNYARAWEQGLSSYVVNSFIVTLGSVAVTVATGAL